MWVDRRLLDLFQVKSPLLQAPMAGSASPELVAAVSGAGALGGFGAAGSSPDDLRATIRTIRALTDRPFNVNLFNASTEQFDREVRLGRRLEKLLET